LKPQHIQIRIEQCLSLAKASHCSRRKLAAMLIDPMRNVVLADGYNGGPRNAPGTLCRDYWCERNGIGDQFYVHVGDRDPETEVQVRHHGKRIWAKRVDSEDLQEVDMARALARAEIESLRLKYPPIQSGTHMERGCHHAEMNVICNAAAGGVKTAGAWLIVLAEPCMMCAKITHHAGIEKVIVVAGGYLGGKDGVKYLSENGVRVEEVEGPQDPRIGVPHV
jgi:deoxycytidylate deaminase